MPSKLSKLADELDGMEDEPTGSHHFHLPKGTQLEADATGRLRAISIPDSERETPMDPPRPISVAPKSGIPGLLVAGGGVVVRILSAVNNVWTFLGLLVLAGTLVAYLLLRR